MNEPLKVFYEERFKKITAIEKHFGINFHNSEFAIHAITTVAFAKEFQEQNLRTIRNFEALGTLGDAIIKMVLSEEIFKIDTNVTMKILTDVKKEIESNENFYRIAEMNSLANFLLMSPKEEKGSKKMATAIEALTGALYLSAGMDMARQFIMEQITNKAELKSLLNKLSNT